MPRLTKLQADFIEYYIMGASGAEAARQAGFSPATSKQKAYQLLQKRHVREALQERLFDAVERHAPLAVSTLVNVMSDPNATNRDRITAARALLDRTSLAKKVSIEHEHKYDAGDGLSLLVEIQRAAEERRNQERLEDQHRGNRAQIIEIASEDEKLLSPSVSHNGAGHAPAIRPKVRRSL